ncbi:uncharacterized protein LOC131926979 [Physella acuta]|uniref:uncharacterized protein LOC131926979 n=1 Tax=Physella acuta TaxID=109671 RepID=UPI0027DBB3AA|nr:uncharacterized protein LOC131926979 [Physella acuta]
MKTTKSFTQLFVIVLALNLNLIISTFGEPDEHEGEKAEVKEKHICHEICQCSQLGVEQCWVNSATLNKLPSSTHLSIQADAQTVFPDNSIPKTSLLEIFSNGAKINDYAWNDSADSLVWLTLNGVQLNNITASFSYLSKPLHVNIVNSTLNGQSNLQFKNLDTWLIIESSCLTKMPKIKNFQSATKISFFNNSITKIENLPNTNSKYELYLNRNKIKKIENLPNSIRFLTLHRNNISEINKMPESLTQLHLSYNKICQIRNIPFLVVQLVLSSNKIDSIGENSFPANSKLEQLFLFNNSHPNMQVTATAFKNTPNLKEI